MRFNIVALCLLCLCGACKNPKVPVEALIQSDFDAFYAKFHSDSLYQIAHIRFPLQGVQFNSDSATVANNPNPWTLAEWKMLRKPETGNEFNYEIASSPLIEGVVTEKMLHLESGFSIERRFFKDPEDKEWYLIYYMDSNKLRHE